MVGQNLGRAWKGKRKNYLQAHIIFNVTQQKNSESKEQDGCMSGISHRATSSVQTNFLIN